MAVDDSTDKEISDLQHRLAELDRERMSVFAALEQLKRRPTVEVQSAPTSQMVDDVASPAALSNAGKVALFRSFFRGRDDVFPAGGKMPRPVRRATRPRATTNGFAAPARSRGSSAARAQTRHSCLSPMRWDG